MDSDLLLLQRHTAFARRLAHALVRDADAADDLVQDAWVAALEAGDRPEHPRSWLATVVRRGAGKHLRARRRRREREARAARPEALPSAAEHSAAMEMHELVLRCLRSLEQPYQRTLLLRFFEDLGPAEIAARTGEKLETVRTVFDENGDPITEGNLAWSRSRSGSYGAWGMDNAEPDDAGVYRIVAPLGRIGVHAWWSLFSQVSESFGIMPGTQAAHIEVRRQPSAWIQLVDGDTNVPLDWGIDVAVEGAGEGRQAPRRRVIEHGRVLIVGPEPGRFTVRIAEVPGFHPIPDPVVELRWGEPEEFVVELRRR